MAGGNNAHILGRASLFNTCGQRRVRLGHTVVEAIANRLADIQVLERLVQRVEQVTLGRFVLVQVVRDTQRHAGGGDKIAGGLVDLHHVAGAHEELGVGITPAPAPTTRPAVQRQQVCLAIPPLVRQEKFLVMAIGGGVRRPVDVG